MGITAFDTNLINKALTVKPDIKSVMELGSQNLYLSGESTPPFANKLYKIYGIDDYHCIDLGGDNNALQLDLAFPIDHEETYDLVTDFGTSEHVVQMDGYSYTRFHGNYITSIYPDKVRPGQEINGLYWCWLNKHDLLKIGGIMINVNPKFGNWPGHGYHYYSREFYHQLVTVAGYKIHMLGEHAAMGNTEDGWNVYSVLEKTSDAFPNLKEFKKLKIYKE